MLWLEFFTLSKESRKPSWAATSAMQKLVVGLAYSAGQSPPGIKLQPSEGFASTPCRFEITSFNFLWECVKFSREPASRAWYRGPECDCI